MRKGYIYVLSNPSMPDLVKIGYSVHGGRKRAKEINQTGVPSHFVLEFEILTEHYKDVETVVHEHLGYCRENENREFFRVDVDSAISEIINAISETHIMSDARLIADEVTILDLSSRLSSQGINVQPATIASAIYYLDNESIIKAINEKEEAWKRVQKSRLKLVSAGLKNG